MLRQRPLCLFREMRWRFCPWRTSRLCASHRPQPATLKTQTCQKFQLKRLGLGICVCNTRLASFGYTNPYLFARPDMHSMPSCQQQSKAISLVQQLPLSHSPETSFPLGTGWQLYKQDQGEDDTGTVKFADLGRRQTKRDTSVWTSTPTLTPDPNTG